MKSIPNRFLRLMLVPLGLSLSACSGGESADMMVPPDSGPALDLGDAGGPDLGPADLGAPDTGPEDLGTPDLGPPPDFGQPDMGAPDLGPIDCARPTQACDNQCTDVRSDPMHCGACGLACASGEACVLGYCGTAPTTVTASIAPFALPGTSTTAKLGNDVPLSLLVSDKAHLAIDPFHNTYVAYLEGNEVFVSAARDDLVSFGAPVSIGMTGITQYKIALGVPGVVYIAGIGAGTPLLFARSVDYGQTWEPVRALDAGPAVGSLLSRVDITAYRNHVHAGLTIGQELRIYSNSTNGEGAFTQVISPVSPTHQSIAFDTDPVTGAVLAVVNGPMGVTLFRSEDHGLSFDSGRPLAVSLNLSLNIRAGEDAFFGGSATGPIGQQAIALYRIEYDTLTATELVADPRLTVGISGRPMAMSSDGTLYTGALGGAGTQTGVNFQRLPLGETTLQDFVQISPDNSDSAIQLAGVPDSEAVMVAYQENGQLMITVHAY